MNAYSNWTLEALEAERADIAAAIEILVVREVMAEPDKRPIRPRIEFDEKGWPK